MNRLALAVLVLCFCAPAHAATDWAALDKAIGRAGVVQSGEIHRYGFPRSDLTVNLDGVRIRPALALGSWLAFRDVGDEAEVMGDLVLTQSEVNPVLSVLLDNGLTITALHNHLLRSSPATMYMHVYGHGDAVALASALKAALSKTETPLPAAAGPPTEASLGLDQTALEAILRKKGKIAGGTLQFSFQRAEVVTMDGMPVPASLGLGSAVNFQSAPGGMAAVTGDLVLLASEITPVLKALRQHGIEVTALHNHMTGEQPRLFFMHYWGHDKADRLANGISAALSNMNVQR